MGIGDGKAIRSVTGNCRIIAVYCDFLNSVGNLLTGSILIQAGKGAAPAIAFTQD